MQLIEQGIKNYINAYSTYMSFMQASSVISENMIKASTYYLTGLAKVYNVNMLPQNICVNPKR